jgi:hypothetical protein
MRFLYGLILGILGAVIAAILYLAVGGGEYLLVLSPTYHQMKTRLEVLEKAEAQRDQLAQKLEALETKFQDLARRFGDVHAAVREPQPPPEEGGLPPSGEPSPKSE